MKIVLPLEIHNYPMEKIFQKYRKTAIFVVIGAGVGFAYWRFIGCSTGTCPMTASWHTSTLMGGLIGMLVVPSKSKSDENNSDEGKTAEITGIQEIKDQTEK